MNQAQAPEECYGISHIARDRIRKASELCLQGRWKTRGYNGREAGHEDRPGHIEEAVRPGAG